MVSGVFGCLLAPELYGAGTASCLGLSAIQDDVAIVTSSQVAEGTHGGQQQTSLNRSAAAVDMVRNSST